MPGTLGRTNHLRRRERRQCLYRFTYGLRHGKEYVKQAVSAVRVISLTDNVAFLTALANDHGYEDSFAGQLALFVEPDDVLIAVSASGNSPNVLKAALVARQAGAK